MIALRAGTKSTEVLLLEPWSSRARAVAARDEARRALSCLGQEMATEDEEGIRESPFALHLSQADDGTRTHDTWLGKPVLYQLSYVRASPILARLDIVFTRPPYSSGVRGVLARSSPRSLSPRPAQPRRPLRRGRRLGLRGARHLGRHLRRRRLRGARNERRSEWQRAASRPSGSRRRTTARRWTSSSRCSSGVSSTRCTRTAIRVVAWYLPGHVKPALDSAVPARCSRFRTPQRRGVRRDQPQHRGDEARNVGSALAVEQSR